MSVENSSLPRLRPAQLRALRSRLQLLIRDASQTDLSPEATHPHAPYWHLEPAPLVLAPAEWATLEAACIQRARLINALLADVYNTQEVLQSGILPPEVVFGDPYYRRPCLRLDPARADPATVIRFDLVKTPDGWLFTDTRANTPIGLSYAVQNRRFLSQEAGELYGALPDYHSIINFPLKLLAALHDLSPRASGEASIVILTAGPHDPFYSEHSFLARKMGLPLARGDDLLVLDNRVYFKTIAGLEPVDVIYRRLNDAHIDPVVFSTDRETVGVPGLLQCIRHGTVAMANAIGTGLAESRALEAYLPRLMRFYFGEKPLLPSIPTYTCGDHDQLDYILDSYSELRIRPIHDPRLGDKNLHEQLPFLIGPRGLAPEVSKNPFAFVAQKSVQRIPLETAATHTTGFTLSLFVLSHGRQRTVLPGGLVHLGSSEPPRDRVGVTADTIVLQDATSPVERDATDTEAHPLAPPRSILGSRAAENLLWLGRYLERAEATARMLSIFDDVALEEIPARDRHRWLPIWRGLFEATGHATEKIAPRANPQNALSTELIWRMTLSSRHPSSIFSSIGIASENARQLRDHVSPECWAILSRLHARLGTLRRPEPDSPQISPASDTDELRRKNAQEATQAVTTELNAFLGTAERTMLHDASWHFLRIGLYLERAIMTCSALRYVLGAIDEEIRSTAPFSQQRENPELSALLRMLGSQDAYRRIYQTRTRPRFVAALFLQQTDAPRSIYQNLRQIRASLLTIQSDIPGGHDDTAVVTVGELLQFLDHVALNQHFDAAESSAPVRNLEQILSELLERLYALHPLLSDHYFSHQARIPAQAELHL
ncbi:MAG: circularly permuted type 2 ATP-grasp protein [Nibricoccus sp.]